MAVPLDEYPLHQVPLSLAHVASTDRNAYDRSYFNAHDRTGELFLITGFGVYPNLGVTDAFALVRRGDQQSAVHFSDALGDDRLDLSVGAYRIEVLEPLRRLRLVCDDGSLGLSFDLTWEGSFAPLDEQHHILRTGRRAILDACRFAQVGTWEGTLSIDGDDHAATVVLVAPAPAPATPADATAGPAVHEFAALGNAGGGGAAAGGPLELLHEVEMGVTAELGRTRMLVRDILDLAPGSVIELDRAAGAPVDVLVNGTLIARGEVVVIDEEFGIRITEVIGYDDGHGGGQGGDDRKVTSFHVIECNTDGNGPAKVRAAPWAERGDHDRTIHVALLVFGIRPGTRSFAPTFKPTHALPLHLGIR